MSCKSKEDRSQERLNPHFLLFTIIRRVSDGCVLKICQGKSCGNGSMYGHLKAMRCTGAEKNQNLKPNSFFC